MYFTFTWPCIITNFFWIKPTRSTNFSNFILSKNSTCFEHFLCPSSGVLYYTFDICIFLAGLMITSKQCQVRLGPDLTLLGRCHHTRKKYTNVECTVENSWWWAKEMLETCSVFWQNKIWEIRDSCWFYQKGIFYVSVNKLLYTHEIFFPQH
jgi:hypothetical protein